MTLAEYIRFSNQFQGLATNVKSIIKGKHLDLTFRSMTEVSAILGVPLVRDERGAVSNKQEYIDALSAFDPNGIEPQPPKESNTQRLEELYRVTLAVKNKNGEPKHLKCIMRMMHDHLKVIAVSQFDPCKPATYRQMSAKIPTTTKRKHIETSQETPQEFQQGEAQE